MPGLNKEIIYPKTVLLSEELLENLNHTYMYILTNQITVLNSDCNSYSEFHTIQSSDDKNRTLCILGITAKLSTC